MILPACRQAGATGNIFMQFKIKNISKSLNDIMRTIGYQPAYFQNEDEFSIVRKIGGNDYPRFHLYVKEINQVSNSIELESRKSGGKGYIFNLHLDQKKPSYEGSTGHSGDYDGPVVEGEARRIQSILNANN